MTTQSSSSKNAFIADVCTFFDGIIRDNSYSDAQKKDVLNQYHYEFNDFGKLLAKQNVDDIKSILDSLVSGNTHTLGSIIAEQLVKQLADRLEASDFLFIVKDPKFSHLYYKLN